MEKEKLLNKQYNLGKVIVIAIAMTNVIFTIIGNTIGNFNFINIFVQIVLSIALIMAVRWVRWIFIVGSILCIGMTSFILADISRGGNIPMWIYVTALIDATLTSGLLIFNKSVKAYFNIQ